MEFRNSDSRQVDWVKALKTLFMQLKDYLKQHHGLGPSWNTRGVLLRDYKPGSTGAASKPKPASAPAPASAPPGRALCNLAWVALHRLLPVPSTSCYLAEVTGDREGGRTQNAKGCGGMLKG